LGELEEQVEASQVLLLPQVVLVALEAPAVPLMLED
jgi:hypothetical protein